MNKPKHPSTPLSAPKPSTQPPPRRGVGRFHPEVRTEANRAYADPTTYSHPWPSMVRFAKLLALGQLAPRTRHTP